MQYNAIKTTESLHYMRTKVRSIESACKENAARKAVVRDRASNDKEANTLRHEMSASMMPANNLVPIKVNRGGHMKRVLAKRMPSGKLRILSDQQEAATTTTTSTSTSSGEDQNTSKRMQLPMFADDEDDEQQRGRFEFTVEHHARKRRTRSRTTSGDSLAAMLMKYELMQAAKAQEREKIRREEAQERERERERESTKAGGSRATAGA